MRHQSLVLDLCERGHPLSSAGFGCCALFYLWVSLRFVSVYLRGRRVSARVPCSPGQASQVFSTHLVSPCQPGMAVRRLPFGACLPRTPRWRQIPKELRTADALAANEISRSLAATEQVRLAPLGHRGLKFFRNRGFDRLPRVRLWRRHVRHPS